MNRSSNLQGNSIRIPQGLANTLAVLIILFLVAAVIGFLYLVIAFVCPAVMDFFAALTSLDAAIIVALVTGLFSIVAIAINSIVKARSAKNAYLREHREKPYFELISLFYDFQSTTARGEEIPSEELIKHLILLPKSLCSGAHLRLLGLGVSGEQLPQKVFQIQKTYYSAWKR